MSIGEQKNFTNTQTDQVFLSINDRTYLAGVDTRGCTCFHHGMSPAWHSGNCAWITAICKGGGDNA